MATITLHAYKGTDDGTASCDYRGERFIGHEQGDEHRTIFEKEFGPGITTNAEIEAVLEHGPALNRVLSQMVPAVNLPEGFGSGSRLGLRIGVWDE
jgi:hypothetical protein